jgi:hypothetical protein
MVIYSIYKATNKINGKSYIGFDSKWPNRKQKHLNKSFKENDNHYNSKFHRAIRKHGLDNFEWEILYQSKYGKYCLDEMETYFINHYDTFNNGYNMTLGGQGSLGIVQSEETRLKRSNSLKGQIPWCKGIKINHTKENLKKFSENAKRLFTGQIPWNKGKTLERKSCVHCCKVVDCANMKRWHGDRCKMANI